MGGTLPCVCSRCEVPGFGRFVLSVLAQLHAMLAASMGFTRYTVREELNSTTKSRVLIPQLLDPLILAANE